MNLFNFRFDSRQTPRPAGSTTHAKSLPCVTRCRGNQATLRLSQQRLREDQVHDLGQQLLRLLEDDSVQVLRVDLRELNRISSDALTQFARAHYRAGQLGKQVVLENACDVIRDVFHVTRLDRLDGLIEERRAHDRRALAIDALAVDALAVDALAVDALAVDTRGIDGIV